MSLRSIDLLFCTTFNVAIDLPLPCHRIALFVFATIGQNKHREF